MNLLSQFHFIRPHWLWALIPLAILVIMLIRQHKQKSGWQGVLATHLYQHLITHHDGKGPKPHWGWLSIGWLLAVFALAGPTWEKLPQPVYQMKTGKVVVMDMSMSMRATDIKPDRLTRAKYKAIDLIKRITEGQTGLIAYAGEAFTVSPLSTDSKNLNLLLPSLTPEIMPVQGSDPLQALQKASDLLHNAGFDKGQIFWITDGVELQQMKQLTDFISQSPYHFSILGVGSEDGAPIKQKDGQLFKDQQGNIVIPKMDISQLQALANKGHGRYSTIQTDDSDIQYLTSQPLVDHATDKAKKEQDKTGDQWKEAGPWLLLILLPLAAYAFRRGLVFMAILVFSNSLYMPDARADWWHDMWQRPDQQAQQEYNQHHYRQAAQQFQNPMWQGSAYYKQGDYRAAAQAFSQIDTAQGKYNLGNALAKQNKLDEAIKAYDQALQKNPHLSDAQTNKALLEKLKKKQQQNKQQQNKNNKKSNKDDKNKNNNQQNNNSDKSKGKGTQQQKNTDPQQQKKQQQNKRQQDDKKQQQQQEKEKTDKEQAAKAQHKPLTEKQKEQQMKMQTLLRKVPDDPAFLLKRKMQLEYQRNHHRYDSPPGQQNW